MKAFRIYLAGMAVLAAVSLAGCASGGSALPSCCWIAPPDIHLTGEKTVIERQIVGDYRELEKDAWMLSSVKTNVSKSKRPAIVAGGDEELFAALKVREFHEETIRKYKDEGALGEGSNGLLVYMRADRYESDKGKRERLLKIIEEENRARRVLWTRSLVAAGAAKPGEKELMALASLFAEEQRALAARNDWIQDNSGRWVRKK